MRIQCDAGMGFSYRVIVAVEAVTLTWDVTIEDNSSRHQDHGLILVKESQHWSRAETIKS